VLSSATAATVILVPAYLLTLLQSVDSVNVTFRCSQQFRKMAGKRRKYGRKYGKFHCKNCNRMWESAHVYVKAKTGDTTVSIQ